MSKPKPIEAKAVRRTVSMPPHIAAALEALQTRQNDQSFSATLCRVIRVGLDTIGGADTTLVSRADDIRRKAVTNLRAAVQTATELMHADAEEASK